jgi:hypothetical protein
MTEQKPFHPGRAQDVIPASAEGEFLTPVCIQIHEPKDGMCDEHWRLTPP